VLGLIVVLVCDDLAVDTSLMVVPFRHKDSVGLPECGGYWCGPTVVAGEFWVTALLRLFPPLLIALCGSTLSWLEASHSLSMRIRCLRSGWIGSGDMSSYHGLVYADLTSVGILPLNK
jgi:hypothetical protein